MGESRRKKDRYAALLRAHPLCCFCGGARPSTTIDHAPARVCFKRKVGPEGYELPACLPCNRETGASEQVAALYIRMADFEDQHFDASDLDKLISGVANNAPQCLPDMGLSANDKRRTLRERGLALARGQVLLDAPIAGVPKAVHAHIEVFARKMLAAMYYRETERILGPEHALILHWAQMGTEAAEFTRSRAEAWFGELRVGTRQNADIGTQYRYKFGHHPNHGFFGLWMEFGQSFGFFTVAGPADRLGKLERAEFVRQWAPIDEVGRAAKEARPL